MSFIALQEFEYKDLIVMAIFPKLTILDIKIHLALINLVYSHEEFLLSIYFSHLPIENQIYMATFQQPLSTSPSSRETEKKKKKSLKKEI